MNAWQKPDFYHHCGLCVLQGGDLHGRSCAGADLCTSGASYSALVAYVRTVKTSSGATAVQIVWSTRRGSRNIEHLCSAHDEVGVAALKAAAAQRLAAGQAQLDLGLAARA